MNDAKRSLIIEIGNYVYDNKSTIRNAAKKFTLSKSLVHLYLSKYLLKIDQKLFNKVKIILNNNFNEKHIRGGEATRKKYLKFIKK